MVFEMIYNYLHYMSFLYLLLVVRTIVRLKVKKKKSWWNMHLQTSFLFWQGFAHTYRRDLSKVDKMVLMSNGMEKLRDNGLMKGLISKGQ